MTWIGGATAHGRHASTVTCTAGIIGTRLTARKTSSVFSIGTSTFLIPMPWQRWAAKAPESSSIVRPSPGRTAVFLRRWQDR